MLRKLESVDPLEISRIHDLDFRVDYEIPATPSGDKIAPVWPDPKLTAEERSCFIDWVGENLHHLRDMDGQWHQMNMICRFKTEWSKDWSRYYNNPEAKGPSSVIACSKDYVDLWNGNTPEVATVDRPAQIVSVDSAQQTQARIIDIYCQDNGISFEEKNNKSEMVMARVKEHMRRTFGFKRMLLYARPINYARKYSLEDGRKAFDTSCILTPGHPSCPDGHGTNAKATVLECEKVFGIPATRSLKNMANEFSTARIKVGVHWVIDGWASSSMTKAFAGTD